MNNTEKQDGDNSEKLNNDDFEPGKEAAEGTGAEPKKAGGRPKATQDTLSGSDPRVTQKTADYLHRERYVRIMIPSTEKEKEDVPVSLNGHTFLIQRDKPVEVPKSILEVLDHATMTVYTQQKRESGEGFDLIPRQVKRFPYQMAS